MMFLDCVNTIEPNLAQTSHPDAAGSPTSFFWITNTNFLCTQYSLTFLCPSVSSSSACSLACSSCFSLCVAPTAHSRTHPHTQPATYLLVPVHWQPQRLQRCLQLFVLHHVCSTNCRCTQYSRTFLCPSAGSPSACSFARSSLSFIMCSTSLGGTSTFGGALRGWGCG